MGIIALMRVPVRPRCDRVAGVTVGPRRKTQGRTPPLHGRLNVSGPHGGFLSYFDHISCHACKGNIDPDRIKPVEGRLICPYCNTELKLTDLFGIKASFAEDDQPDLTLDQLVPGDSGHLANPWGQPEGGHSMNQGRWEPDLAGMEGIHTGQPGAGAQQTPRQQRPDPRASQRGGGIPEGAQVARHIDPPSGSGRGGETPRSRQIADNGGRVPERRPAPPAAAQPPRRPASSSRDNDSGGGTSALDALRRLKGKK